MKRITLLLLLSVICLQANSREYPLNSPDGKISVSISDNLDYAVTFKGKAVFSGSAAIELENGRSVSVVGSPQKSGIDHVIPSPFYRNTSIEDRCNSLIFKAGKDWKVEFRAYDDGVAYRWIYTGKAPVKIVDEKVSFRLSDDATMTAGYIRADRCSDMESQFFSSFENDYEQLKLSEMNPSRMVFLPLAAEPAEDVKILFTESDLSCYPGLYLLGGNGLELQGVFPRRPSKERLGGYINIQRIVEEREDCIARLDGPRSLPWRIAIIGDEDRDLAMSQLSYQLASPCRISDTSWIKPGKVAWDWWNNWNIYGVDFEAGVNQKTYEYYIDFAAENGIEYVIMDDGWSVPGCGELFSVVPEINMPGIVKYAADKGVGIILWAGFAPFEKDLEDVCRHYSEMGVKGFKVDFFDRNDQVVEEFVDRAAETAARYHLVLDLHGFHIPAGINRKWPNVLNTEGVNGLERLKGCDISLNQVKYDTYIPFIRQAAGPMDYTQGAMLNGTRETYRACNSRPMSQGTRCHQLGLYPILDSPLNMLCYSPSNYIREQECTDFIADIPTIWDETIILDGRMGEYCVTARRSGDDWYIGGITDWTPRDIVVDLSFLREDTKYVAEWYLDGPNAHRHASDYRHITESAGKSRKLHMAPGGGFAAKISPMTWDRAYTMADEKLSELTLDEKKGFMFGHSTFYYYGVPHKGIPYLYAADGTQGVHIRRNLPDTTLVRQLDSSTAFPTAVTLAATFNPSLAYDYARAIGEECRAGGIEILLGPGVNMAKNAKNGRNYEYLGEDPYLSSVMASNYVKGLQSTGTAACMKHFVGNESELYRQGANALIDERALHEVYMAPFRAGIDAGAGYIMTGYNLVNGEWASQSTYVIDTLLRRDLGFRGSVMSDWGGTNDSRKVIDSGQNTIFPGDRREREEMEKLFVAGAVSEEEIDRMIRPVIATGIFYGFYDRPKYKPELLENYQEHVEVAYRTAAEGTVLLRNNGILPLADGGNILVTGRFLDGDPRLDGWNPTSCGDVEGYDWLSLRQALSDKFGSGITFIDEPTDEQLEAADAVIVTVGTIDLEAVERPFALPENDERRAMRAVAHNANTIVLVISGSAVRMTGWNDKSAAILYCWYPGQTGMKAVADILAGDVNPSGKLPMTIDREYSESPSGIIASCSGDLYEHLGERTYGCPRTYDIPYHESVLVGHRWYDAKGTIPLYPFGHGLSYTTFSLSKPEVRMDGGKIYVSVEVRNTGDREGAQVVQLYVGEDKPTVLRPLKELKGMSKLSLVPGMSGTAVFELNVSDLSYWDDVTHDWHLNSGKYTFYIGTSSADIILKKSLTIK